MRGPDTERYVKGKASDHVDFLHCELISERSHIHGWSVEPHFHEGLDQFFVFGEGRIEGLVNRQNVSINGPAVVWIPALIEHAFRYTKGMKGWVITIPCLHVFNFSQGQPWLEDWVSKTRLVVDVSEEQDHAPQRLAQQIHKENKRHGKDREMVLQSLLLLLFASTSRLAVITLNTSISASDRKQVLTEDFLRCLDDRIDQTRSVADYAKRLSVTTTHLTRVLRAVTGRSAGELIHDRLLLQAKRQLVFTDKSVANIAYDLDFSSPSYFTRLFVSKEGETPVAFRIRTRAEREVSTLTTT